MIRFVAVLALAAVMALAEPAEETKAPDKDGRPKPIPYPSSAIPKDDVWAVRATALDPVMVRDRTIEAPETFVQYFLKRPTLAYRLLEETGAVPFSLDYDEEEAEWDMTTTGKNYTFRPLKTDGDAIALRFTYFFRFMMGIGIKSSGGGAVVIRAKKEKDTTVVDFDIYMVTGNLPLDRLTKSVPFIQIGLVRGDFEQVANAFIELCESAADDPETMAEDMEYAEETFTEKEIAEFRKTFIRAAGGK